MVKSGQVIFERITFVIQIIVNPVVLPSSRTSRYFRRRAGYSGHRKQAADFRLTQDTVRLRVVHLVAVIV